MATTNEIEQLSDITRENFETIRVIEAHQRYGSKIYDVIHKDGTAYLNHVLSLFPEIESIDRDVDDAMINDRKPVVGLSKMPAMSPMLTLFTWNYLTREGIDNLDKAKFVHRYFGNFVLNASPMPDND